MTPGLIFLAGIAAIACIASVLMLRAVRRYRCRLDSQELQIDNLRNDVRALCTGAVGLGERVSRIDERSRRIHERQEQLQMRDPGERTYAQAIRMVQNGATIDEIIKVCEISRGEADLLMMMHHDQNEKTG
jgi:hypothetical protein